MKDNLYGMKMPSVNHCARTIYITERFERAAAEPHSPAFEYLMTLRASCPNYTLVRRGGRRSPTQKAVKISYQKMRRYISCLRNSEMMLKLFEKVVVFARSQPMPYQIVRSWFDSSFPDYGSVPDFDKDGFPLVEAKCVPIETLKSRQQEPQTIGA